MEKDQFLSLIKKRLIVSCQALEDEPLHGASYMAKMAAAAIEGGAVAIRANSATDIEAIKQYNKIPVIGLVKRNYSDSDVYITPTKKEIDELLEVGTDVIALDATKRKRPNNEDLKDLFDYIHSNDTLILADVSNFEEGITAFDLGADMVSTTLSGYTDYTQYDLEGPDMTLVEELAKYTEQPIIAEGRVNTPEEARITLEKGAYAVIVGSAITRPQLITKRFVDALRKKDDLDENAISRKYS